VGAVVLADHRSTHLEGVCEMIGDRLDRLTLPLRVFMTWLYPLGVSVQRGVDACPAAVDAQGMSVGAVSVVPPAPAPTRPVWDQILAVTELYAHHQPKWDTPSTIKCRGCLHVCHSERRHWRHVTELATDMMTNSYRIQQLLNK
jgi:hypothetical protein